MSDIYKQHDAAFANVAAYVILNLRHDRVATIAFKFPRDGAGRLWCYVQWCGTEMVRGYAAGGGYDKRSASAASAACRLALGNGQYADGTPHHSQEEREEFDTFVVALSDDNGHEWANRLRDAGFVVLQAV